MKKGINLISGLIGQVRDLFQENSKKNLLKNFTYLSLIQVFNYILPFITLPYITRVLGPEKYGLVNFAYAFIAYFQTLTEYGFFLSATREVSIHRNDKTKLSEIFSSVLTAKIILMTLSFLMMIGVLFLFQAKFRDYVDVSLFSFGIILGNVLFPVWFFQGIEDMKFIAFTNVIAKFVFTVSIFIFVKHQSDYALVPLINSAGFILSGAVSLFIALKFFGIRFKIPGLASVFERFKSGWYLFISQVGITFFTASNTFILGLIKDNINVGYYSFGDKIVRILVYLSAPISGAIFPGVSKMFTESKVKAFDFLRKVAYLGGGVFLAGVVCTIFLAGAAVSLFGGNEYRPSILVIQILSFIILTVFLNNIFGTQIMLNTGYQKEFMYIMLATGLINVVLTSVLSYYFQYIGTALSSLASESFIMFAMYYYARKAGFRLFFFQDKSMINS